MGIPVLVLIAVLIAWGTIVESQYDAFAAKKIVYDSWMMWAVMVALVYNLTVVVLDRWPWQVKHYPFITVHAGLILIIFGGYITSKYGLDGQMVVPIGGKNNLVSVGQTDVVVYATFDGDKFTKIVDREVDFFNSSPTKDKPFVLELGEDKIEISEYVKYAQLKNKVKAVTDEKAGASIRFQLMNARVKQVEQLTQSKKDKIATFNLGPAKVHLGEVPKAPMNENAIYFTPLDSQKVRYTILSKDSNHPPKKGELKIGEIVSTGWMGLELRLLDYLPLAAEVYDVTAMETPSPLTTTAVKIVHQGIEKWLALNDVVKLFGTKNAYLLSYQNRRIDLGFDLKLKKFDVARYQGTTKAMEYSSLVEASIPTLNIEQTISMNEPLKFMGYTIYQASFQEDEQTGQPVASVFSINQDPGRWIKYIGCLVFSLGIIMLFYQRRKRATAI